MRRGIGLILLMACFWTYASDLKQAYQEGTALGASQNNQSIDLLKTLDLAQFPGYQPNLSQENYYGGVTQESTRLKTDSQAAVEQSDVGKTVNDTFNQRPYYRVNPASESMQKLNQIAENGDAIMHGKNTEQTTCALRPKECHYSWQQKTCLSGKRVVNQPCVKQLNSDACSSQEQSPCDALMLDGCEQIGSMCIHEEAGYCATYQQTYQCPLNQCSDNQLICGEDAFCLEGDCSKQDYVPAQDGEFKKAISALSVASEASKDFDGNTNFVFKGQLLECSKAVAGVKNCCRNSGWGIDLNLAHCNDMEKKLGKARENKLVVPTGEYCAKRKKLPIGSICVDQHETFCVFQSKLARIVQEQGRHTQLGIGFGKGKYSNCSGITPEQMQLIKFENINFSEFYEEIQHKLKSPNTQQTTSQISQRLKDFYNQGDTHG